MWKQLQQPDMNSSPRFTEDEKGITDAVPVHIMQSRWMWRYCSTCS